MPLPMLDNEYHPNFPKELDIEPQTLNSKEIEDDAFGTESQREAIREYGIAGRVW